MRLNQVTVEVTDVARAVEFYRGLGLIQIVGGDEHYARFLCPDGDSTFSVERAQGPLPGRSTVTIYFECDDLDGVVASLAERGYAFDHGPVDQPWLWREARLRDPDGNQLCLFRAGENRIDPPWRLPESTRRPWGGGSAMRAADWDRRWNERLEEGVRAPSALLAAEVEGLEPGRALDLACGAGRNAVWLAERGWRVTGVDFSEVALAAARRHAAERGVELELVLADVTSWEPPAEAFDLVCMLYLQLPVAERRAVLERARGALAPGGTLLVVAHDARNLTEGYGGPTSPAVLYTADDVRADLEGLEIERAELVRRPVETEAGERIALDALVRARRPA
jgi:SAM-dependent methyltransferase/predicted enzyme related to lactoylglutathione lyase